MRFGTLLSSRIRVVSSHFGCCRSKLLHDNHIKEGKSLPDTQPVPGIGWKPRDAKRFVLSSQKSNNNVAFQVDFLKSGWGALFWKSPSKRGTRSRRSPAPRLHASSGRGDPDGFKGPRGVPVPIDGQPACARALRGHGTRPYRWFLGHPSSSKMNKRAPLYCPGAAHGLCTSL